MACGAPRAEPAPAREQRKTLTILFCDVALDHGRHLVEVAPHDAPERLAAERLAREGVEFALQTDFVATQALAYEALASVTGDAEARERARALLEAKGYQPRLQAYS